VEKHLSNKQIVNTLKEVLAAMEIKGYNKFRIRAYQNAIAAIDNLTLSVYDLWQNKRLDEIPGVGSSLEQHITDLFEKGTVKEFDAILKDLPQGMFSLIQLRGIGAKKAFKLAKALKLTSRNTALKALKEAAEARKIRVLEGFGEKSEAEILNSILDSKKSKSEKKRMLLIQAETVISEFIKYMKQHELVEEIHPLGSLRRRSPTVGDVDIAVATKNSKEVIEYFTSYPHIREVLSKGDKMATVLFGNDLQIDLLTSHPDSYGAMLQHFTGSKQHNILLRTYALENGMSLSQYGIKQKDKLLKFANEKDFYKQLGLAWIPPELREGTEEIVLARQGKLPELVKLYNIRGDLHMHTSASDGLDTLEKLVATATKLGYEYIGIADHAPSIKSHGYNKVARLLTDQRHHISKINKAQDDPHVFFGYEVSILADTNLALPNNLLAKLDYVVAGVHSAFNQDRDTMTQRLVCALAHPLVNILAHPSGRQINERNAADIDWKKVFETAKKHNKILEINAQPLRLDLTEDLVKEARTMGIRLIINTDAHDAPSLNLMRYGVDVARRGWCTKGDVVNTLPLEGIRKVLKTPSKT
jgi:DNA polymerase (family X)